MYNIYIHIRINSVIQQMEMNEITLLLLVLLILITPLLIYNTII